jgi:mono/diheme cytochrome c family protein
MRKTVRFQILFLLALLIGLGFAACKGAIEGAPAPGATSTSGERAEPTRITDATAPATHVWAQPTTLITIQPTPAEATATPASADEKLIQRGKGLFETKGCGGCHGDNAEGLPDQGPRLAGTTLAEAELEDVLRTGGKVGNEHLFGISAISRSGINAIYTYLQSLGSDQE